MIDDSRWYEHDNRTIALNMAVKLARFCEYGSPEWIIQTAETFLAFLEPRDKRQEQDPRTLI